MNNITITIPTESLMYYKIPKYRLITSPQLPECPEWASVLFDELSREELLKFIYDTQKDLEAYIDESIIFRDFSKEFEKYYHTIKKTVLIAIKIYNSKDLPYKSVKESMLLTKIKKSSDELIKLRKLYDYNKSIWCN